MRHLSFIILLLLTLCGCTKRLTDFGPPEFGTIERGEIVYIVVPDRELRYSDDRRVEYGRPVDSTRYPDIEVQLAKMLQNAFAPFAKGNSKKAVDKYAVCPYNEGQKTKYCMDRPGEPAAERGAIPHE